MFKNCSPDKIKERDRLLEQVKLEMEDIKADKISKLKQDHEVQKQVLQKEKQTLLRHVKDTIRLERPAVGGENNSMVGDMDYMLQPHTPSPPKDKQGLRKRS